MPTSQESLYAELPCLKKCLIKHFSPAVMVHIFLSAITKTVLCQLDKTLRAKLPYLKKRIITHFPSVAMVHMRWNAMFEKNA